MSERVYCPTCRNMVSMDYPHSCYDAVKVIALQDAERAVVEAVEEWERYTEAYGSDLADVVAAVRALRAVRDTDA